MLLQLHSRKNVLTTEADRNSLDRSSISHRGSTHPPNTDHPLGHLHTNGSSPLKLSHEKERTSDHRTALNQRAPLKLLLARKRSNERPKRPLMHQQSQQVLILAFWKVEKRLKMEGDHCISTLEIAEIYFNTSPESFKQLAEKLFNSMDEDQDEKVSRTEFLNNMKDEGLLKAENPSEMFNALDVNGDGSLDLKEMMALYYVIKSGRPFCGGCGKFIPGMFFTCLYCFDNEDDKFCICPKCFSNENYNHKHMPDHFLDNFALLEVKRTMAMAARKPPPPPEEPKKKSGLLRLFESQTMRKVFGAAAVASTEVAVTTTAAVDPDNCSIL